MPTIRMNKKRFIKLLGKRLDDDELGYYISMIGTDLEEISPEEIIVEVFPNRPDMLSEEGFARAMRYFLGIDDKIKMYKVNESSYHAYVDKDISRKFVGCAVVKDVDFDENAFRSLIELQEKLHITHGRKRSIASIGVHNLDVIEFPITYKRVNENFSFIPLGYDKEMTMKEILEKHEKGRQYKHLVKSYEVWVDNKGDVLAFPPVINAQYTAIDENTQNFFIDVTGTNKRVVEEVLNIVVTHLLELDGETYKVYVNNSPYPILEYRQKTIDIDYVNKLLGLNLSHNYIKDLLLKMGIGFKYKDEKRFNVLIPPYRTDILHDMDIVEDIAISYGYDKFSSTLPNIFTISKVSYKTKFENILRDIFIGLGALEVITYHLSNENILYKNMIIKKYTPIKVIHPMNEEYDTLRNSIFPLLLDFLSKNKTSIGRMKIFFI